MNQIAQTDRRSALLAEAEKLIRTRGYAGFSYADLSASVGITKASIHHHFPTKEQLVTAALDAYRDRYTSAFVQIEENYSNALDRIEAYGRLYLGSLDEGVGCLCAALAVERDILSENLLATTAAFFRAHLLWLESVYAEGLSKGEVSTHLSAASAAQLVLSLLEGALLVERMLATGTGFKNTLSSLRATLSISCDP